MDIKKYRYLCIPSILIWVMVAFVGCSAEPEGELNYKTISFSGYDWYVKSSDKRVGPSNNFFSDSEDNIWVDDEGLHMKITNKDGNWYASEVVCTKSLGYGKYIFYIDEPLDKLDDNVILGLFTYDLNEEENHREIDIEFSKWGNSKDNDYIQYVVQPYDKKGNLHRFSSRLSGTATNHIIDWQKDRINFQSNHSFISQVEDENLIMNKWEYKGEDIPKKGKEKIRINLYLLQGGAPVSGSEVEVIIKKFEFIP